MNFFSGGEEFSGGLGQTIHFAGVGRLQGRGDAFAGSTQVVTMRLGDLHDQAIRAKRPLKRLMDKLPELTANLEREYHARKGESRPE
ncbi:MAG TPA: hypothetical protein VKS79_12700 [Gemmataceae bacterium]|nr:hypothetical protein [Gemmataceae bacterium]